MRHLLLIVLLGLAPLSAGAGTQTLVVPPLPGLVGQRLVLQSAAVDPISFDRFEARKRWKASS